MMCYQLLSHIGKGLAFTFSAMTTHKRNEAREDWLAAGMLLIAIGAWWAALLIVYALTTWR